MKNTCLLSLPFLLLLLLSLSSSTSEAVVGGSLRSRPPPGTTTEAEAEHQPQHHQQEQQNQDDNNNNNNNNLEDILLSIPDPQRLRSVLYDLTSKSHVAGTKGDWENAEYVKNKLQSFGYTDAHIESIPVMMTYPASESESSSEEQQQRPSSSLLTTSFGFTAKLSEDIVPADTTSGTTQWRNHTFLAYSPSGTVTTKLVYANYGRPQDFDILEQYGVSVAGNIVIMRYGECFRGLKIMNAEERGAVGTILYSDPQQDGYGQGATWPNGSWRPPSGVQRGSTQFVSKCIGDPWRLYLQPQQSIDNNNNKNATTSTPAATSSSITKQVCGYDIDEIIPKHPAIPISYEDAQPLLVHLGGGIAPDDFQGDLPFQYTFGPSEFDVTLRTNNTFVPKMIPNVIATLYASDAEEEAGAEEGKSTNRKNDTTTNNNNNKKNNNQVIRSIILGNHRDAWVFGAVDPNSGTTALLEVARTLATLQQKHNWKPKRNIVLASWSGEEYGFLGSTAYAELKAKAANLDDTIAYLNVDCAVKGNTSLIVSATHSLTTLFQQAAQRVPAPPPSSSLPGNNSSQNPTNRTMADGTVWKDQYLRTLGSGSDYTPFLDRYGIASLDMSYEGNYGVYHSVYDSFSWMEQQGDPTFEIHQAMTRLWSLMAFRLATNDILPINMTSQANQINKDIDTIHQSLVSQFGKDQVNTTQLITAAQRFRNASQAIDQERKQLSLVISSSSSSSSSTMAANNDVGKTSFSTATTPTSTTTAAAVADLNRRLALVEREFLTSTSTTADSSEGGGADGVGGGGGGLPKRPYFRHLLQAPGFYLGYGSQPFPGIADAILDNDTHVAQSQVNIAAKALTNAAVFLRSTTNHSTYQVGFLQEEEEEAV